MEKNNQEKPKIDLSIVIPAYNEEKNIELTLKNVEQYLDEEKLSYEVIIVDDGSRDKTVEIVSVFSANKSNIKIIKNPHRGKGFTVRTGVFASSGGNILFMDADGSTPIRELKRLSFWLTNNNFDIVIASREGKGARRTGEPYLRHLMGRVFNFIVQLVTLPGINDTQCGFKLFRSEAAKNIFSKLSVYGDTSPEIPFAFTGAFDVEVLYLARKFGYTIKEVPIEWTYSKTERVDPLRDSFRMFRDVLKIRLNDLRGRYK